MPTEAWGNAGPVQEPYDMEPDGNYKLKVVINRECNAIEAGNSHANGKALKVTGKAEINAVVISSNFIDGNGGNLRVGASELTEELLLGNSTYNTIVRGQHLLVLGNLDAEGDPEEPEFDLPLGTQSYTRDVLISRTGQTTTVQGKLEVDEGIGDVSIGAARIESLKVGASDAAGEIDSGGSEESKQDLKIGVNNVTNDVRISHNDRKVILGGSLRVGALQEAGDIGPINRIDANAGLNTKPLYIGTLVETGDLTLSRTGQQVKVKGHLEAREHIWVGDDETDGMIDAADDACNLKIGTQADYTGDVEIGHDDSRTIVRSDVLKVGQADEAGLIESGGTTLAPEDLNIGTNGESSDIILGRAGVTVDVQCQTRLNGNALIMNGAASILDANGCGQVFNAVGHPGPNMPCMDQYINGVVVGWIDANGWNNA